MTHESSATEQPVSSGDSLTSQGKITYENSEATGEGRIEYTEGGAEKTIHTAAKVKNAMLRIWVYLFYGGMLVLGIWGIASGMSEGWYLVLVSIILLVLYWLFGYVLCCK